MSGRGGDRGRGRGDRGGGGGYRGQGDRGGGGGYRGQGDRGGGGGGYRGQGDRGGGRGGGGSGGADNMSQSFGNMNMRGGGRGDGGRGGGGGRPRGGGGGRSVTRVLWGQRNPNCQNEKKPEYPSKPPAWKHMEEDPTKEIALPARKNDDPKAAKYHIKEISLALNHFETKIVFPKIIHHYRVDIERVRQARPAPKESADAKKQKKPTGKSKGGSPRDEPGGAPQVRLLPTDLRKRILRYITPVLQNEFGFNYGIITDYSASIYAVKKLEDKGAPLEREIQGGEVSPDEDGSVFKVSIKQTTEKVDTTNLKFDVNNMRGQAVTQDLVNLERIYSTLIRCVKMNKYTPMKRSYLIDFTKQPHPLGGGVVSYAGYDIMLPMANGWKKFVNIEIANLAAYKDGPVLEVLRNLFESDYRPPDVTKLSTWGRDHFDKANSLLRTCKVMYRPCIGKTFSKVVTGVCKESVSTFKFQSENGMVSIADYFRRTYNTQLKFLDGPVLECKGNNSPKIPAEICILKDGQSFNRKLDENQVTKIAEVSRKTPDQLQPAIADAVSQLQLSKNPILDAYGMSMPNGKMHKMNARVLTPPELCFGTKPGNAGGEKALIVPDNGEWDIWQHDFEFFRNCTVKLWGILNLAGGSNPRFAITKEQAYGFSAELTNKASRRGINMERKPEFYRELQLSENNGYANLRSLSAIFNEFRDKIPDPDNNIKHCFVLVILPKKGSLLYNHVKQASELGAGILTQCVVGKNTNDPRRLDSICGNIMLKINSKLTAVNHVVLPPPNFPQCFKVFEHPTMIIGADVTHPPPGSSRIERDGTEVGPPSFAAITASIDRTGMPYMMHIQAQEKAGRGAAEVITGLDVIMKKFLTNFYIRTRVKPCRIIIYRDGVGEGQFQEVLRTEMGAIRRACSQLQDGYKPSITFVTVQKRHKTRFFYDSDNRGNYQNAPPGTVVDSDIVHPVETDFYLLSHKGLLGTSRPTRYHVLWDDSDFSMGEIQILSYFLCYMFVRCNRSVKIPAPTYYAHWAAKRAEVLAKGVCENMYGDITAINAHLNGGKREEITKNFPMHFV